MQIGIALSENKVLGQQKLDHMKELPVRPGGCLGLKISIFVPCCNSVRSHSAESEVQQRLLSVLKPGT